MNSSLSSPVAGINFNPPLLIFQLLVSGSQEVESEMFTIDAAATSDEHRFIYDAGSGDLFYDSDGIGDDEQVKLVRLDSGLNLGSDDLFINS